MKRLKALDFEVLRLPGPARLSCQFITRSNDSITFRGDSIEEIFDKCQQQFPDGLMTKGIVFSGTNNLDAKRNLSQFLSLGFRVGYFKQLPSDEREDHGRENENI
jgi:hypothetical protein